MVLGFGWVWRFVRLWCEGMWLGCGELVRWWLWVVVCEWSCLSGKDERIRGGEVVVSGEKIVFGKEVRFG